MSHHNDDENDDGDRASPFVYVDDDGNELPPEEATSLLYADALRRGPPPAAATAESEASKQEWLAESSAAADDFLARCGGFDVVLSAAAAMEKRALVDAAAASAARERRYDDDGDNAANDDSDADDAGMMTAGGGASFSREYSDVGADGDWVLECVLRRRNMVEEAAGDNDDNGSDGYDYDDADGDDAVGYSATKQRAINNSKVPHYLCKWKWYAAPTWESRRALLDLGHGDKLRAYDAEHSDAAARAKRVAKANKKAQYVIWCGLPVVANGYKHTIFEELFPDALSFITDSFERTAGTNNLRITSIANVAPPAAAALFLSEWQRLPNSSVVRVFHGTAGSFVPAICSMGLVVPGARGCTVANGSAYGVGIYTARAPDVSIAYTKGSEVMFVCVGLVDASLESAGRVRTPASYCVFFESALVVPVWLVRFEPRLPQQRGVSAQLLPPIRMCANWLGVFGPAESEHADWKAEGTDADAEALRQRASPNRVIYPPSAASAAAAAHDDNAKATDVDIRVNVNVDAKLRQFTKPGQHLRGDGGVPKKMLKQMPRNMKSVFGY